MEEEKIDYFYLTMRAPVGETFYTDMVTQDAPDELRRLIEAYSDAQKNVTNETAAAFESKNTHALDRAARHLYSIVVAVREYRDENPNNILAKKMVIMCGAYSEGPCCHAVPDAIMSVRIALVADGATPKQLSDEFGVYPRPLCVRDENKHKLFGQEMETWSPAHDVLQYIQIVLRDLSYDIDELARDVNGKSKF